MPRRRMNTTTTTAAVNPATVHSAAVNPEAVHTAAANTVLIERTPLETDNPPVIVAPVRSRRSRQSAPAFTVSELIPLWEASYRSNKRINEHQIQWYVQIAKERIIPLMGDTPVDTVDEEQINELCAHYAQHAETYIYTYLVIRSLFAFAHRREFCASNPVPIVYCKLSFYASAR